MKTLNVIVALVALTVTALGQAKISAPLFLHFGVESANSTKRLLSTQIHLGQDIYVGGDNYWKLTGHIDRRGTNIVADLVGDTGSQSQFYRGTITLERPFFAQGGAASGVVIPIWFVVSTNADGKAMVERVKELTRKRLEQER